MSVSSIPEELPRPHKAKVAAGVFGGETGAATVPGTIRGCGRDGTTTVPGTRMGTVVITTTTTPIHTQPTRTISVIITSLILIRTAVYGETASTTIIKTIAMNAIGPTVPPDVGQEGAAA